MPSQSPSTPTTASPGVTPGNPSPLLQPQLKPNQPSSNTHPFRNRYQNHLPPHSRHTTLAIYGHDAKAGLQVDPEADISPYSPPPSPLDSKNKTDKKKDKKKKQKKEKGHRYAYGLDTGCGHGRQLTALVIEAVAGEEAGRGAIRHRIEQVDCGNPGVVVGGYDGEA